MSKKKKKANNNYTRHLFLLTFFDKNNRFEEIEVNGYILQRRFNNFLNRWEVGIYTKESHKKAISYLKSRKNNSK